MHELGVMIRIVEMVEGVMKEENLTQVEKIVLEVGELSSVIPIFLEKCYPAAVDGTPLEYTVLEIQTTPGNALCRECKKVYRLLQNHKTCPHCGGMEWELLSGNEFVIKEIVAC